MINLAATNRCSLFEDISEEVWQHLIHNHSASMDVSEIGITKDIISSIRNHSNRIPNFGVWANPGYNENVYGSDMDVFVETTTGNFVWYALQAKALRTNGRYQDMAGIRNGEYQWDKLNRLSTLAGCITKYLLFNGVSDYTYSGRDFCNRNFDQRKFGCSLVEPSKVEEISLLRNPSFRDFHPTHAQPWRIIVCCTQDTTKTTLFNLQQVRNAVSSYPAVSGNTNVLGQGNDSNNVNSDNSNQNSNAINNYSESVNWTPYYRVVIRTTTGLNS